MQSVAAGETVNWFDVLIAVVAVATFIRGLGRGTTKNVLSLLTTLMAIATAGLFYTLPAAILDLFLDGTWANLLGFGSALFLAKGLFQAPLDWLFRRRRLMLLGPPDRLVASFVGLVEVVAWTEVIGAALVAFPVLSLAAGVAESLLLEGFVTSLPFALSLLPSEFQTLAGLF